MQNINNKSKYIALISLNSAIFLLLSFYGTIELNNNYKFTLQNIPIFLIAMLYSKKEAMSVGFIGMLLNQIIKYGFDIFNIIWVIPYVVLGFVFGSLYKEKDKKEIFFIKILLSNIMLTILNTLAMYIHSNLFGYFSYQYIFSSLIYRFLTSIITSFIYFIILPYLYKLVIKIIK